PWLCAAPLRPGGCFLAPAPTLALARGPVKDVNPVHRPGRIRWKASRPERSPVAGPATGRCETGRWPHLPPNRWLATLTCSPVFSGTPSGPGPHTPMAMDYIRIRGARTHNLKNIDLELPRDKLIVITGLSGSGKSSLAFDTIYAEGQRRYVESLSAYARQFLSVMEKPDV